MAGTSASLILDAAKHDNTHAFHVPANVSPLLPFLQTTTSQHLSGDLSLAPKSRSGIFPTDPERGKATLSSGTTVLFRHPTTMALRATADVAVLVNSENSSTAERRVTPSWTISQLKTKLLPVTGIPPSAQQLTLRLPHAPQPISIASEDEENTQIAAFPLQPYCEIHVCVL